MMFIRYNFLPFFIPRFRFKNPFWIFIILFYNSPIFSESFTLTMDSAVSLGIQQSNISEIKQLKYKIQNNIKRERWREYFPKLGISYFGLKNNNLNQQDSIYNDLRVNIQQMIYDGGENARTLEIAELGSLLNEEEFHLEKRRLELEIRKLYLKILSCKEKIHLQKIITDHKKIQWNDTIRQYQLGFKTQAHVSSSENIYNTNLFQYKKFNKDLYLLEKELRFLIGIPADSGLQFEESLFLDFQIQYPESPVTDSIPSIYHNSEYKKQQILINRAKTEKDSAENYWKPKFFIGGYYGKNSNDDRPIRHEVYGLNFTLSLPLGSSHSQTQGNFGVQTDGTGIQRFPGFGPQFVGRGENSFVSSNLQLFDNFSYSRKILEGEVKFLEVLKQFKNTEQKLLLDVSKAHSRLWETAEILKLSEQKVWLQKSSWQSSLKKAELGLIKNKEVLGEEVEFFKAFENYSDSLAEYIKANYEYLFFLGSESSDTQLVQYKKNGGNTVIHSMIYDSQFFSKSQSSKEKSNEE